MKLRLQKQIFRWCVTVAACQGARSWVRDSSSFVQQTSESLLGLLCAALWGRVQRVQKIRWTTLTSSDKGWLGELFEKNFEENDVSFSIYIYIYIYIYLYTHTHTWRLTVNVNHLSSSWGKKFLLLWWWDSVPLTAWLGSVRWGRVRAAELSALPESCKALWFSI